MGITIGDTPIGRKQLPWADFEALAGPHRHPAWSTKHERIWRDFNFATAALRDLVAVPAIWVFGSYLTIKSSPSDIDVVYVVDARGYAKLGDEDKQRAGFFAGGRQLIDRGLLVDSYVLDWQPHIDLSQKDPHHQPYLLNRGYWDDWAQRHHPDKTKAPTNRSTLPKRSYLEVILDGYQA